MSGKCLSRVKHEDGTPSSALAVSAAAADGSFSLALGTESGVASIFNLNPSSDCIIKPLKSFLSLTTKITTLSFNPTGEVLAFASDQKQDHVRVLHVPSLSVFTNWPTERTPLRRVHSLAFSPTSRYLTLGNNRGSVLLYQMNHFSPVQKKKVATLKK
jgi:U3 small nucleolar RNA-associated protein 18